MDQQERLGTQERAILLSFKPSQAQWRGFLEALGKSRRSGYVRTALEAFIAEYPVIQAIPLEESATEEVRHLAVRFQANEEIASWLEKIPPMMRSYMIRHMINWFRRREGIGTQPDPQQRFDLAVALQPTGSDR